MKIRGLSGIIGMAVVMAGCRTGRVSSSEVISTTTMETTVTTTVVETTTVSSAPANAQVVVSAPTGTLPVPVAEGAAPAVVECGPQVSTKQGVDILKGARKPCSTVAADAPKFVDPDKK